MTDEHDVYDEALAREVEEDARGARANDLLLAGLAEESLKQADADASGLIGARLGNVVVLRREKPGKRTFFVCHDQRNGREVRLRGYELVRVARAARNAGLPIHGLREPWRDEERGTEHEPD